jgi:hypothetical protein
MEETDGKLELVAIVCSIVSFFWVGLGDIIQIVASKDPLSYTLLFRLLPYLVFVIAIVLLLAQRNIKVQYHRIYSVKNTDPNTPIKILIGEPVEIYSSIRHFKILVSGVFFGPELNQIRKHFGKSEARVYALVSEYTSSFSKDLLFLQKNEYGVLDPQGYYEIAAYLGGIKEENCAKEMETFAIYILIPKDRNYKFDEYAVYNRGHLPKTLYISPRPIFVTTRRSKKIKTEQLSRLTTDYAGWPNERQE